MAVPDDGSAYGYYANRSGLTPAQNFSLADHQHAFWSNALGADAPLDHDSLELAYLHANTTVQMPDVNSARSAYFAQKTGLSGDIAYLAQRAYLTMSTGSVTARLVRLELAAS